MTISQTSKLYQKRRRAVQHSVTSMISVQLRTLGPLLAMLSAVQHLAGSLRKICTVSFHQ